MTKSELKLIISELVEESLIEEVHLKDYDLVAMYNDYNKRYFSGKLPLGVDVKSNKESEKMRKKKSLYLSEVKQIQREGTVFIGTNKVANPIGSAVSIIAMALDENVPTLIYMSSVYDYAEADDGGDFTVEGILLHEMAHLYNNVTMTPTQAKYADGHGIEFKKICAAINEQLKKEGSPFFVPPDESPKSKVSKHGTGKKVIMVVFKTYKGTTGVSYFSPNKLEDWKGVLKNQYKDGITFYEIDDSMADGSITKLNSEGRIPKWYNNTPAQIKEKIDAATEIIVELKEGEEVKKLESKPTPVVFGISPYLKGVETMQILTDKAFKELDLDYLKDNGYEVWKTTNHEVEKYRASRSFSKYGGGYGVNPKLKSGERIL